MTAAQELFDLLKDAKPGPNYQPKAKPATPPPAAPLVPMYAKLPPKRVELPRLGGSITIEYDDTPFLPGRSYWHEADR